jgi:16S rRNA (adenine1518-N6/adenine1519-N6)-dimethyltransferase
MSELLDKHNFKFQKKYGQNFLTDSKIPARIADNCTELIPVKETPMPCAILEIGPGAGILTKELAKRFQRVTAVEIDSSLLPVLAESLEGFGNIEIINDDIMNVDVKALVKTLSGEESLPVSVCANLPYYITTPVLMKLVESNAGLSYITVMVQKEVARRLCSLPGQPDYGAITAAINLYGKVVKLFDVSAGSFHPRPSVDSAVVRIKLFDPPVFSETQIANAGKLIKAAFGMRRKTLSNALSTLDLKIRDKKELSSIIGRVLPYTEDVRGEKLSAADFVKLTEALF